MINVNFISPTKIYFGKGKEDEIGSILKEFGAKRVLIVTGKGSVKKNGLFDKVVSHIKENNIEYFELSGVRANPEVHSSREGIRIARENNVDFILAIGGGSTIDCAKSIAAGFYYDGDPFDFNQFKAEAKKALPVGVILTLSASGSELSTSCVISNDELGLKGGFNTDVNRPTFAILNPELTYSVDKYQTGCGIVDIISHSLERYFCRSCEYEFSDDLALAIMKNTMISGEECLRNPTNYEARATMMLCGSYSHNGITGLAKATKMSIHAMEHCLSAYKTDIAHGAGLSVLIPAWMEYCYKEDIDKFAKFAKHMFDISLVSKEESAKIGIQSLKEFFKKIGMPITLKELGLEEKDIPTLVDMMTANGTRLIGSAASIKSLNKEDCSNILRSVL